MMTNASTPLAQAAYQEATLPCGLRVIYHPLPSDVVYCGYVVCAGTRHEEPADSGMAHFIEHMTFKGTQRRRACHILNGLERVGGDLNAYTTKQETVYYAAVMRQDVGRAIDLLSDMVFHSTYPQREIDREVEVICDEIDSYKDSPAELIYDEFEARLFAGHGLGRDILGSPERLRAYRTADALRFTQRYYRPANCVFYACGQLRFSRLLQLLGKALKGVSGGSPVPLPGPVPEVAPFEAVVHKPIHQAHVLLGGRTFGGTDARRHALVLLSNLLGGPGMNSRLNVALRERAGLVYTVETSLATYPDTGAWNLYFGCDPHDVSRCLRLVRRELTRLVRQPLTPGQLQSARKQLKGQTGISRNHFEGSALALARTYAHYHRPNDLAAFYAGLDAVTPADVQQVAADFFHPDHLNLLIYEP